MQWLSSIIFFCVLHQIGLIKSSLILSYVWPLWRNASLLQIGVFCCNESIRDMIHSSSCSFLPFSLLLLVSAAAATWICPFHSSINKCAGSEIHNTEDSTLHSYPRRLNSSELEMSEEFYLQGYNAVLSGGGPPTILRDRTTRRYNSSGILSSEGFRHLGYNEV
jgi:hypothetical protein